MPIRHYIIKNTKMKWKGVFDFDKLYKVIKRWMDFEGYGDEMKGFNEKKYKERIQAGGAKLYEIAWEGKKEVSSYFTFVMEITFLLLGVKEIEVEMDGRRVKMNKGEIEMRFNTYVISNANEKSFKDDSWFIRIYENWVIRDRLEQYKINLYKKFMKLQDVIKEELNLYRF